MTITIATPQVGETCSSRVESARPSAFRFAIQDFAPFAAALVPFAVAIGTTSAINGLTLPEATFGAVVLLAGTAQLAAIELIGNNTAIAVAVTTIVLINSRFIIYGAGLANWFADVPLRQRLLLAFPLVDQTFLCCEERFTTMTDLDDRRRYYLAGTAILVSVFLSSQLVGYLAGPVVPDWMGLHLAAPLAFAGMLVKAVKSSQHAVAALAATFIVIIGAGLPGGAALPISIAVGVYAGNRRGVQQ
jgi:predicted branched-subunit amino acid permease